MRRVSLPLMALVAVLVSRSGGILVATSHDARPTFDVASIKANNSGERGMRVQFLPGRLVATNIPVRNLISQAFEMTTLRIRGGPKWIDTDRFDVIATTSAMPGGRVVNVMLQGLLADRCGLVVRHELELGSVLMLKKARSDGKLGPGLRPPSEDCTERRHDGSGKPMCLNRTGFGTFSFRRYTMKQLANVLSVQAHDLVQDRTSLVGQFDIELKWAPNVSELASDALTNDVRPSLLTALRKQLGLKLVRAKVPLDVLIIEQIHRPTPD
jgi:uncharacterized protein (TIGR03435 family)